MSVTVRLSTPFREVTGGKTELEIEAEVVSALLDKIEQLHPGFKGKVFDPEGNMLSHTNVYVNGTDIRAIGSLDTALEDGDVVSVLFAVAGG